MANIKLRIGGQWVTIGGGDLVSEANSYTDSQIKAVNDSISALNKDLGDTNDYIDGSFKDGVITEVEAKKIGAYLNTLTTSKNNLDERTTQILANPNLPSSRNASLTASKSNFDSKYTALTTSINNAIADGIATTEESADVDAKFADFNASVSLLTDQLEQGAMDITQDKIDSVQQYSSSYTDAMKAALNMDVTAVQANINAAKAYIDPVFQGGIVYDADRTQINSWMTTLANDKVTMDNRYKVIDGNTNLTDTTAKGNLETSYTTYDNDYTAFVDSMNSILLGSQVTSAQDSDFDSKITAYSDDLSLLSASGESAIDSIATTKGNNANANAASYSKPLKDKTDSLASDLTSKTNSLKSDVDTGFAGGLLTSNEKTSIQTDLNNLSTSKLNFDGNYNDIYNDSTLSPISKNLMFGSKVTYDNNYQTLVNSVNNSIVNSYVTNNEQITIDNNVSMFNQSVTDLQTQVDAAIDYIAQKKADAAEFAGYTYTDNKLNQVGTTISTIQKDVQTNTDNISDAKNNIVYKIEVNSSNGLVFKNGNLNTILTAKVWYGQTEVSSTTDASRFTWTRYTGDTNADSSWNAANGNGVKSLVISASDVPNRATFTLTVSS